MSSRIMGRDGPASRPALIQVDPVPDHLSRKGDTMKAVVDPDDYTGGYAIRYYSQFPREPSASRSLDFPVEIERVRQLTLESLLDAMVAIASQGRSEVMIVAHGAPPRPDDPDEDLQGFSMPLIRGMPRRVSAVVLSLKRIYRAGLLRRWIEEMRGMEAVWPIERQVVAWTRFVNSLGQGAQAPAPRGDLEGRARFEQQLRDLRRVYDEWFRLQERDLRLPHGKLGDLIDKMNAVQAIGFRRIEVRACNIGQSRNALSFMGEFFGARQILCPCVRTFYGRVELTIAHAGGKLGALMRRLTTGPPPHGLSYRVRISGPHNAGPIREEDFALRVWEHIPHRVRIQAVAPSWDCVRAWVDSHIMPDRYRQGTLYLGGFLTFGLPQGPVVGPFVLPMDPRYRGLIVSVP